jgi:hypothetical protein
MLSTARVVHSLRLENIILGLHIFFVSIVLQFPFRVRPKTEEDYFQRKNLTEWLVRVNVSANILFSKLQWITMVFLVPVHKSISRKMHFQHAVRRSSVLYGRIHAMLECRKLKMLATKIPNSSVEYSHAAGAHNCTGCLFYMLSTRYVRL